MIGLELADNSAAGFVGFAIDTVNIHDWIIWLTWGDGVR